MTEIDRLLQVREILNNIPVHQWMPKSFYQKGITLAELCDLVILDDTVGDNARMALDQRHELEFVILRPEWILMRRLDLNIKGLGTVLAGLTTILQETATLKAALPPPPKVKISK